MRVLALLSVVSLLTLGAALPARAQRSDPPAASADTTPVCFGFAFGDWTPPLDWRAARHAAPLDSANVPAAPHGRGWADQPTGVGADTVLMLFPPWWPVGVAVALPTRTPARGDTLLGRATALVADSRVHPPTAPVRAWRVTCGTHPVAAPAPRTRHG